PGVTDKHSPTGPAHFFPSGCPLWRAAPAGSGRDGPAGTKKKDPSGGPPSHQNLPPSKRGAMFDFFTKAFAGKAPSVKDPKTTRARSSVRPHIEALEDRLALSVVWDTRGPLLEFNHQAGETGVVITKETRNDVSYYKFQFNNNRDPQYISQYELASRTLYYR